MSSCPEPAGRLRKDSLAELLGREQRRKGGLIGSLERLLQIIEASESAIMIPTLLRDKCQFDAMELLVVAKILKASILGHVDLVEFYMNHMPGAAPASLSPTQAGAPGQHGTGAAGGAGSLPGPASPASPALSSSSSPTTPGAGAVALAAPSDLLAHLSLAPAPAAGAGASSLKAPAVERPQELRLSRSAGCLFPPPPPPNHSGLSSPHRPATPLWPRAEPSAGFPLQVLDADLSAPVRLLLQIEQLKGSIGHVTGLIESVAELYKSSINSIALS